MIKPSLTMECINMSSDLKLYYNIKNVCVMQGRKKFHCRPSIYLTVLVKSRNLAS